MPVFARTALCLLLAATWFCQASVLAVHSHAPVSAPAEASTFEAAHGPATSTHADEHALAPCTLCAQQTTGEADIPAAAKSAAAARQLIVSLGSLRSERPFQAVLGSIQSPRPPPLSTASI